MKDQVDDVARWFVGTVNDTINKDVDKVIRYVNNEMYNEATKMYKHYIDKFYLYKTKYYIRHWEGVPGTKQGQNLYFGQDIRKETKKPKLIIYTPEDPEYISNGGGQFREPMEDDYKFDGAQKVLTYVFEGTRFPKTVDRDAMKWSASYKGTYFSCSGTMKHAFDKFNEEFDETSAKVAEKYLKVLGYR